MLYENGRIVDGVSKFFHEICVVIVSAGILLSYILCSIFIKMSRNCVNNSDNFCSICGEVTFASRKCSITPTIKKHISCISAVR